MSKQTAVAARTPGPWRVAKVRHIIEAPGYGRQVASLMGAGGLYANAEANACLIAAAPDLLAVLGDAVRELRIWLDNHREDVSGIYDEAVPIGDEIIARAGAVIAKAEGRS